LAFLKINIPISNKIRAANKIFKYLIGFGLINRALIFINKMKYTNSKNGNTTTYRDNRPLEKMDFKRSCKAPKKKNKQRVRNVANMAMLKFLNINLNTKINNVVIKKYFNNNHIISSIGIKPKCSTYPCNTKKIDNR